MKKKIMLVGGGGRESVFALNLMADCAVYAVVSHENPTIVRCVQQSGGAYTVGDVCDSETVVAFAREHSVDYVFVSADDPLAKGVVDALLANDIRAVGGSRAATRLEWDKHYAMQLMHELCPEYTPFYRTVETVEGIAAALAEFEQRGLEVVVKPQGLTGGKGVQVMPTHLATFSAAADYCRELLEKRSGEKVLLVEKLHGVEFTIMGLTDGERLVLAPATYDYPYRLEGDKGAGTGGMGCLTAPSERLPFMQREHWEACRDIMQRVIDRLREENILFNGVLNGGFFLTAQGIRFMEFNSRFGDPEALNILLLMETPLSELIDALWHKTLSAERVRFKRQASVVKYFVAAEYPDVSPEALTFSLDEEAVRAEGVTPIYASCVAVSEGADGYYRTLKKSRVVALAACADTIVEAATRINAAAERHITGGLEYRRDIGSADEVEKLTAASHR